jgi:Fe-S cluster biogenesis protein NfuA/nitrite reductase/ring-hydroxylating ferredoxin subunit
VAVTGGDVGEQVEVLLERLGEQGGESAFGTAEQLVRVLLEFYGNGLERIIEIVRAEQPALLEVLTSDALVESQLILHGLHPLDADERIERALDRVRPYLGSHAGGVAYLGIDEDAVAHLRLDGSCHGCPSSTVTVRMTIEEAVLAAAPEVVAIEVDGQAERPKPLLQIGRRPGAPEPADTGPVWLHPSARELPTDGHTGQVHLDGRLVLMCRLGETYYAYADRCPACGGSLSGGVLAGDLLACGSCGSRYDVRLAGRAVDGTGRHLEPLPLLDDVSGIRVALPVAV